MQSAGAFCWLNNYAKGLQPAWRSRLCYVWNDGCDGRSGLHPRSINGQKLRQQSEARADKDDS